MNESKASGSDVTFERDGGTLYARLGERRDAVRSMLLLIPKPGDRCCRTPDGGLMLLSAREAVPDDASDLATIEDHFVLLQVEGPSGPRSIGLDTTREAAGWLLRIAYPDAVLPQRRLTRAEHRRAMVIRMGDQATGPCAERGCGGRAVDSCSCCGGLTCVRHSTRCEVLRTLVLGYCPRCAYFLLPDPATVAAK